MFDDQFADPFDLTITDLPEKVDNKRIAVIRTTDRITFKACRRKWGWGSHLRANLGSNQTVSPLWVGSGFHFALEDFHGAGLYGTASRAFEAYYTATRRKGGSNSLPADWESDLLLAKAMLDYYENDWLRTRDPLTTFVYNDQPQVEVNFRIQIPFDPDLMREWGYDEVIYSGTLDRVAIDEHGLLWIVEYKTAKAIQTRHLQTDPQVTAYCWAASVLYPGYGIGGVVYQQHRKTLPDEPRFLASGKLSSAKTQNTSYNQYRRAIVNLYGEVNRAPGDIVSCLNDMARAETPDYDDYIRRDKLDRTTAQIQAEGEKVLLEAYDMLNPDLPLYPNPQRWNCGWCSFQGPCLALDNAEDWETELAAFTTYRESSYDSWRKFLPSPEEVD